MADRTRMGAPAVRPDVRARVAAITSRVDDMAGKEAATPVAPRLRRRRMLASEPACPLARLVAGVVACEDILITREAAELLGVSVAVLTGFYKRGWVAPFAKFGNSHLYTRADVAALQRRLEALTPDRS